MQVTNKLKVKSKNKSALISRKAFHTQIIFFSSLNLLGKNTQTSYNKFITNLKKKNEQDSIID